MDEILERLKRLEERIAALEKKEKPTLTPVQRHTLVTSAVEQILSMPQVSTVYLQQTFKLGKKESIELYDELEKAHIIKTVERNSDDPTHPYKIGKVSKYKAKKFLEAF